jgi:solute carrier family 50 (sugar transporter)
MALRSRATVPLAVFDSATNSFVVEGGSSVSILEFLVVGLLKVAGPMLFMSLIVSSVRIARDVSVNKSCGLLSPIPNICLFTNSFVWALYGILKYDMTVFIPNFSGVICAIYCVWVFHNHSVSKPKVWYTVGLVVCTVSLWFGSRGDFATIGAMGCSLSVLMTASPLAVMRTVIREKSTASLPFTTSLIMWLNSISWLLYGYFIADDILIYGPNILGFMLASMQMALFQIYGVDATTVKAHAHPVDEDKAVV